MGGAERVLLRLLDSLDPALFEPALACPDEGPLTREARERGTPVHLGHPSRRLLEIRRRSLGRDRISIAAYPFDMAVSVARLARLISAGDFDLVLTNSAKADIYGTLAARLAGRPVAWRMHDLVDTDAFSKLNVFLLKTCARFLASRVIPVSQASAEKMAGLGVPRSKLSVAYNGIEPDAGNENEREAFRRELGIAHDAPVAALVGRLVDWKGPDYFIEAAAKVSKDLPTARFLLVGDAIFGEQDFVDRLKAMCHELGIGDKFVFTGYREDVTRIMRSIDLLVHASTQPEPFGMVLIEAMASRCPVVATLGGGVQEIVVDGVTGILVPPKDADAMAKAMVEIMSNDEHRASMGEAGFTRVTEHFSLADSTRAIEQALLGALGSHEELS